MGQPGASYTTTVRLAGGAAGFHDPVATARGRQLNAVVFFYLQHDYDHDNNNNNNVVTIMNYDMERAAHSMRRGGALGGRTGRSGGVGDAR